MVAQDCDCGNERCPRSPAYKPPCGHCMCLRVPDIPIGQTRWVYGPVGKSCCRCGHFQVDDSLMKQTYTASGRLEVTA